MGATLPRAGFALAAAGQLAYVPQQSSFLSTIFTLVAVGGFAMAASAAARGPVLTAGLALASLAALTDAVLALSVGFDIWFLAQALWTVGLLMCLASARSHGHDFGIRAGAATAAFGSSLWILLDPFNAVSGWLLGNVLSIAGLALVAASFDSTPPSVEGHEAPA